ncbi:hypothetical protein RRG08_022995 [Elysia crispata]|uniref:Uncharacterized protein n=1 Tax=Elysia crispata TaxID=231223 RepID=A0AAE1DX94_9GAST|nr:hypothetical protein RRG08_022995 [Elysia crispata]
MARSPLNPKRLLSRHVFNTSAREDLWRKLEGLGILPGKKFDAYFYRSLRLWAGIWAGSEVHVDEKEEEL